MGKLVSPTYKTSLVVGTKQHPAEELGSSYYRSNPISLIFLTKYEQGVQVVMFELFTAVYIYRYSDMFLNVFNAHRGENS